MKHRTFLWFFLPSATAMFLFIALPIVSVLIQSIYAPHEQVIREVENCTVFGCTTATVVDQAATRALRHAEPMGRYVGPAIYMDRNHLAVAPIGQLWRTSADFGAFAGKVPNLPFYGALAFTLAYTAVVTPLSIVPGFVIALSVNALPSLLRGPKIFVSLLPMIVTPLIGALILFWMVDARGILGAAIQWLAGDPGLSVMPNDATSGCAATAGATCPVEWPPNDPAPHALLPAGRQPRAGHRRLLRHRAGGSGGAGGGWGRFDAGGAGRGGAGGRAGRDPRGGGEGRGAGHHRPRGHRRRRSRAWILSNIKLGRLGEATDIMGPVVFLAFAASAMVTGTHLLVDGGWTAG